jgi:heterodisulfide reductase subunit B2
LLEDIGIDKLRKRFKRSLNGLKVASYYGCLLVRPNNVTDFDDAENPQSLDKLVTAMGGQSLDWPYKVECCGGGLSLTRVDVAAKLSAQIVEAAEAEGADCIAVACPMCQASLDLRRKDIDAVLGKKNAIPVLYVTQLLGLCLGIPEKELGLNRLMVPADGVLKALQPAATH